LVVFAQVRIPDVDKNSWDKNGAELAHLTALGMSPLQAIEAATATGPLTLGPQAPRSRQQADGYDADVLILDADPLADIAVLTNPAHVTGVWAADRRVK
jgi:imidazolonepropionase-like amidohydrolase